MGKQLQQEGVLLSYTAREKLGNFTLYTNMTYDALAKNLNVHQFPSIWPAFLQGREFAQRFFD